jgi:asparagine synthase (glutamine-hydrolysing)
MCGIAGVWGAAAGSLSATARSMANAVHHRGPDSSGEWNDVEQCIALAHRRLSILDLSSEGCQPMVSASGRYVIVFNGEIYNFAALRRELEPGVRFRGGSDTEVLLAAVEEWGIEAAVGRFIGMFAFALWDRAERRLSLVRDRLGIKPLYYGWSQGRLLFASELKAFRAFPGFHGEIDRDAVTLLLRHNCIPAPFSIYRDVRKLPPGTVLALGSPLERCVEPVAYWSAREVAEQGMATPFEGSDADAVDALDTLLRDAVGLRMIADVPLGAFLSGGVDSSVVVALMQQQSSRPIRTFSIGSPDRVYDEAGYAASVARHLGTEHTELCVESKDALDVVPLLGSIADEPFADSSLIPTYIVSALARRHVTVSLSGDGGDELFGGYNRHLWAGRVWRASRLAPMLMRRGARRLLKSVSPGRWDRLYDGAEPVLPTRMRQRMAGYKIHKLADVLTTQSPEAMYHALTSHWPDPAAIVAGSSEPVTALNRRGGHPSLASFAARMMYLDLITYLPDDILTKVDRASMAVSLEARVPLLDHRVVEFAWSLPMSMKIRGREGKWILRRVLERYLPRSMFERPKTGFGVPLNSWLRGPLRAWAEELIDERRLQQEGFFDPRAVRSKWQDHLSGRYDWQYHLWDVLMFQAWLENAGRPVTRSDERASSAAALVTP